MVNSILNKNTSKFGHFKRKKNFFSLGNCLLKHHDLVFREGPTAKQGVSCQRQKVFDSHLMI